MSFVGPCELCGSFKSLGVGVVFILSIRLVFRCISFERAYILEIDLIVSMIDPTRGPIF